MSMLEVTDLSVEVAGTPILEGLTLSLRAGDKTGVVGRNGAGKTSLLNVIAGDEPPLAGRAIVRGRLGYLRQEPRGRETHTHSALAHVLEARGLQEMAERLEKFRLAVEERPSEPNIARFTRLEERYRAAGGYSGEAEARRIAAGLGLPDDRLDLPVRALSGGERRRLELARILFSGSDLLLLDEPTNHLDSDAKHWLMRFLAAYRGALVVVSHDLALLDGAITRILHLDRDGVVQYRGTYSEYRAARRADETRLGALAGRQQAEVKRLKTLADSMRGQTVKRAKKAKALDSRVRKLEERVVKAPTRERLVRYRFPEPPRAGAIVLEAEGLAKGYGGPPVFEGIGFHLARGERLLIMGLNGAGKSRSATTRRSTRASATAIMCSPTSAPNRWTPRTRTCAACSGCSASPAASRSRTPARSPVGRRRSSRSRSSWPGGGTSCCSTSRPTTWIRRRGRRWRRRSRVGRVRWCW
jgi:ATPase subunit of ABC transporter with duplicated ATPase domains